MILHDAQMIRRRLWSIFPCFHLLLSMLILTPLAYSDDIEVTFQVNMQRAFDNNCFTLGQPIYARCGFDSSAARMYDVPLIRDGLSTFFQGTATITRVSTDTLLYRYVTYIDETEAEEHYFDYHDTSPYLSPKSKRKVDLSGEGVMTEDFENSIVKSNRMPVFPNPNMLSQNVVVTWECDMRPAYHALSAGKQFINVDGVFPIDPITEPESVDELGVFINGTPTGMWRFWRRSDLLPFQLVDDGTEGDVTPGDSIYTIQFWYPGNQPDFLISHYFKMSINGGNNEGGLGASHMINLDDTRSEIAVRFTWGEVDPTFYSEWDYDTNQMTAVHHQSAAELPEVFHLYQNYPNPFNPTTIVRFDLSQEEYVSLKVFNLLGQEIETLVHGQLAAGQHHLQWTAPSALPTGLYWCELKAGERRDRIRLMLLK
jgi:hypothetical protein